VDKEGGCVMLVGKKQVKKLYENSRVSEDYSTRTERYLSYFLVHKEESTFLDDFTRRNKFKSALDLACGTGRLLPFLHVPEIVAVDNSIEMLRYIPKECGNVSTVVSDIFKLKLSRRFDLVISFRFFRHFDRKDREDLYNIVNAHLKSGGYFVLDALNRNVGIYTQLFRGLIGYLVKIKRFLLKQESRVVFDVYYTKEEIIKELSRHGFEVVEIIPVVRNVFVVSVIDLLTQLGLLRARNSLTNKISDIIRCRSSADHCLQWIIVSQKK
jgi:SAM-dependent methyltransferase